MTTQLVRNWWKPVLQGVLATIFGILLFVYPTAGITAFIYLFGAYALLDGIANLAISFDMPAGRGWMILGGVAGIAAGILTFLYPGATAVTLVYVFAAWAVITGIAEIAAAVQYRTILPNEWALALAGVLSVLVGLLLFMSPQAGLLAYVWLVGIYAVVTGGLLIYLGFRIRRLAPVQAGASA
jgi:uncharacterized membrane protein HdeD (DUF308 family)